MQPVTNKLIPKVEQPKKEETMPKPYCDVVNVSEGFQLRTAYKKKVKPSKLDGLLERRVKQFTLEEKQRLERMKQAALLAKTAAMKPASTVRTEGSVLGIQQHAASLCVKEEEESLQVKEIVVKKLDFERELTETKAESLDVKPYTTAPRQTAVNAVQENSGDINKEVNGRFLASKELISKNSCISDSMESKGSTETPEVARLGENTKKRGYEEMVQGSGESSMGSMEVDPNKTNPVQVNGRARVADSEDTNINSDLDSRVQVDTKEPVRSLMNGNVNMSETCHPPPMKVPKLDNHMNEKGDSLKQNEQVSMNSGGTVPAKLPSSSPSCLSSNCTDNEGLKATSAESQIAQQSDVMSQAASSTVTITNQPSSMAAIPQKAKAAAGDTKTEAPRSTTTSSMTISKEYSTRDRVSLLKFSKSKKARSGTALPSYRKFVTKSSKKSIFILPNDDLKRLARKASNREVPIFNYNAKPAPDIWPYPSPRPTFGITWRQV